MSLRPDELLGYDALGLAELVRSKAVQPIELVDLAIARIEALNPNLNAIVTPMYDRARDAAELRDVSAEEPAALHAWRNEFEAFFQARGAEWGVTRRAMAVQPGAPQLTPEACERLRSLGYVGGCGS